MGAPGDEDDFQGFLFDRNLAALIDENGRHSGAPERTGTHEFMRVEALEFEKRFIHTYYDDIQSFILVFVWLYCEAKGEEIEPWGSSANISADRMRPPDEGLQHIRENLMGRISSIRGAGNPW